MPKFINTVGEPVVAIAYCDRCGRKFKYVDLHPDRNNPGLRVCDADNDMLDPYKLPPRQTENITLRYPRPEKEQE